MHYRAPRHLCGLRAILHHEKQSGYPPGGAEKKRADENVEAGCEFVAASVEYVHYVEGLHEMAQARVRTMKTRLRKPCPPNTNTTNNAPKP